MTKILNNIKNKFFKWLLIRRHGEVVANRMILGARLMGNHLHRFNHGGWLTNTYNSKGERVVFFK